MLSVGVMDRCRGGVVVVSDADFGLLSLTPFVEVGTLITDSDLVYQSRKIGNYLQILKTLMQWVHRLRNSVGIILGYVVCRPCTIRLRQNFRLF